MHKNFYHKKSLITLTLITCLCFAGCGNTDSQTSTDTTKNSPISTEETGTIESQSTDSTNELPTDESSSIEETSIEDASDCEDSVAVPDMPKPATIVAYATGIEEAVWREGALDIRFPEANMPSASWNQTLPIPLWGETDIIALVPAPLSLENIQNAGYSAITEDGSTAAFLSNGSAESYIVGYMSQDGTRLDYTVADLDIATLLGSDAPTLQHVLDTLGVPDLGFAYDSLEVRYYYLFDSYYIEVSMSKADASQASWGVSEILYFDSSAFLNHDFEQELNSIKESGRNGFTSEYLAPTGF